MKSPRPNRLVRILLAAFVVANGLGAPVAFGHSHPIDHHGRGHQPHHPGHDHLGPSLGDAGEDDHPTLTDSLYHRHGFWLGLPFSLPGDPDAEGDSPASRPAPAPRVPDLRARPSGPDREVFDWLVSPGVGPPERDHSPGAGALLGVPPDGTPPPGALRARCLALRR